MQSRRHPSVRSETGQSAVEFALLAPALLMLLLGIAQGGIAFHNYLAVTDAARSAARQAIMVRISNLTPSDVRQSAVDAAADLDTSKLNVTMTDAGDPTFTQPGSQVTVTVTYPYTINVLGLVVASGNLTSTMKGRLE